MIGMKSEAVLLFRKFITSKTPPLAIRNLYAGKILNDSENEKTKELPNDKVKKPSKKSLKNLDEIYDYFKGIVPVRILMQRKSMPRHLYLFDHETATTMTDAIKDDLLADPQKIIEFNAGAGVLTEKLISAGVPTITIMEPSIQFLTLLSNTEYSNKIILREVDLTCTWKIAYQDKQDGGSRVADLFSHIPSLEWGEETGLKIIGPVTSIQFLSHVILDVVRLSGFVSYGRPCFYLAMPPSVWTRFTCDSSAGNANYRASSVLFQLFFDFKLLRKVPRKAFLPWLPSYTEKVRTTKATRSVVDKDQMYIVKIEGKKNLFTEIIDPKYIKPLWYFVNHHLMARTNRVIPQMEAWEPGCGPNFIMQDFNIYSQFGDLSPEQILSIFKTFTTYDGYHTSFIPSMENSLQKMDQLTF